MILVCCFIAAIFVAAIAGITIFLHPTKVAKHIVVTALILGVLFGGTCAACTTTATNRIKDAHEAYDNLLLYYYTVETSNNEYVRYDYFNKVNEYNNTYTTLFEYSNNPFVNWFYKEADMIEFDTIDFQLHGDGYEAEG